MSGDPATETIQHTPQAFLNNFSFVAALQWHLLPASFTFTGIEPTDRYKNILTA